MVADKFGKVAALPSKQAQLYHATAARLHSTARKALTRGVHLA